MLLIKKYVKKIDVVIETMYTEFSGAFTTCYFINSKNEEYFNP